MKVFVRTRPTDNFAHDLIDFDLETKTVNVHAKKDARRGVVNNQMLDWSFKMDGILHNCSQDQMYSSVASEMVSQLLDGYNGTSYFLLSCFIDQLHWGNISCCNLEITVFKGQF